MADAPVLSVHDALISHLSANCPACPAWYAEDAVPRGATLPYGVLSGHAESPDPFIGHDGASVRIRLRWFNDDRADQTGIERGVAPSLVIWSQVRDALHRRTITIATHQMIQGNVSLISTYRDVDGYRNGVADYVARTLT